MVVLNESDLKLPKWLKVYAVRGFDEKLIDITVAQVDDAAPIEEWQKIYLGLKREHESEFLRLNAIDNASLIDVGWSIKEN